MNAHGHEHHKHHHDHGEDFDPGSLYSQDWVQRQIGQIKTLLQHSIGWLGIESDNNQRILDYACGNGTVSLAYLEQCPNTTFQGLDSHPKQVTRFNDAASQALGQGRTRMFAIEGNLESPSPALKEPQWFEFDFAFISMALHHVTDPVKMLSDLRKRIKRGGVLVVIEWASKEQLQDDTPTTALDTSQGNHHDPYDPEKMIEVIDGQKIWNGFTPTSLKDAMVKAGCTGVEVRASAETFEIPGDIGHGGLKHFILAKGTVQ